MATSFESTTTTPTRRLALQDISVNVALVHAASPIHPRRVGGGLGKAPNGNDSIGAAQPRPLGEDAGAGEPGTGAARGTVCGEAGLGGAKRIAGVVHRVGGQQVGGSEEEGAGAQAGGDGEGGGAKRKRVEDLGEGADDDAQSARGVRWANNAGVSFSFVFPVVFSQFC
jgi:hypothetical protein